jgi:hypothetical protein
MTKDHDFCNIFPIVHPGSHVWELPTRILIFCPVHIFSFLHFPIYFSNTAVEVDLHSHTHRNLANFLKSQKPPHCLQTFLSPLLPHPRLFFFPMLMIKLWGLCILGKHLPLSYIPTPANLPWSSPSHFFRTHKPIHFKLNSMTSLRAPKGFSFIPLSIWHYICLFLCLLPSILPPTNL